MEYRLEGIRLEGDRLVDADAKKPRYCIHRRRLAVDWRYATESPICRACEWESERLRARPA